MLAIICTKYGKNSPRTVRDVEWIRQDVLYFSSCTAKSWVIDHEDVYVKFKGHYVRYICLMLVYNMERIHHPEL